jgi:TonB family protein
MKILQIILFVFCVASAAAQSKKDTIYYDKDWKRASASKYEFYRIVTPRNEKLYVEDHYSDGHIQMTGSYTALEPNEIADGHFLYFSDAGVKTRDEYYKAGLLEGDYMVYDSLGHLTLKMYFKHDKWDGRRTVYYSSGAIYRDEIYKEGKFVSGHVYDAKGKELPFYPIEEAPEFPGGDTAMAAFIHERLQYPMAARALGIEGTVKVRFLVGTDGQIEDATVSQSDNLQLNQAAVDVVMKLPKFKPGRQDGKAVKCAFVLPIVFKLAQGDKKKE